MLLLTQAARPSVASKEGMQCAQQYGDGYSLERLVEDGLVLDETHTSSPTKQPLVPQRTTRHLMGPPKPHPLLPS